MLKIKQSQIDEIEISISESFVDEALVHIEEYFFLRHEFCGEDAMRHFVRTGIARAAAWEIEERAAVRSYIDHMLMLGVHFDEDPFLWKVREILMAPARLPDIELMDRIYAALRPVRLEVRGPDGRNLFGAAARLHAWLSDADRDFALDDGRMQTLLSRLFPEKWEMADKSAVPVFLDAVRHRTQAAGFHGPRAAGIVTGLAFCAGIGVLEDPTFSGGMLVRGDPEKSPDENCEHLRSLAVKALQTVIDIARREGMASDV